MKSENIRISNFFVPMHPKKFVLTKFSGFQPSLHSLNSKSDTEMKDFFDDNIEQKHVDYCFNMDFLGSIWVLFSVLGDQGRITNKILSLRLVEWAVSTIRHGYISGQASPTKNVALIKAILKSLLILFNYY